MTGILSPFKTVAEVIPLIEAGATELYCGYLSPEWSRKFTGLEFERKGEESNFTDLNELKRAVAIAHGRKVPVYLALNGLYVNAQYPLLTRIIAQLEKTDLDAYIVADLGVLLLLRRMGSRKKVHISTGGTVFNAGAAAFYRRLGASRIVLDRQTGLETIRSLVKAHPDLEFEVFILNTLCMFIDGFCTFMHAYGFIRDPRAKPEKQSAPCSIMMTYDIKDRMDACGLDYAVQVFDRDYRRRKKTSRARPVFYKQKVDGVECGACFLYDLKRSGITAVKIVGRQLSAEMRSKSTVFIKGAVDLLERPGIDRRTFIASCQKEYARVFGYTKPCGGNNCYHPQVLRERSG